ncbi:uncharacterized protein N7503_011697 [Penicillium pulvis]|uniref:uncharacterized protein n=1 Tax=Penicillium pulvis TaxID=1562058 RepID=UPI00254714E6|nr:uncharacterized protein N7503_011697 [Penicillium pulvis]KAJ5786485.1 hypothetical protein N7503_011697 [Penicillium pulvis]
MAKNHMHNNKYWQIGADTGLSLGLRQRKMVFGMSAPTTVGMETLRIIHLKQPQYDLGNYKLALDTIMQIPKPLLTLEYSQVDTRTTH